MTGVWTHRDAPKKGLGLNTPGCYRQLSIQTVVLLLLLGFSITHILLHSSQDPTIPSLVNWNSAISTKPIVLVHGLFSVPEVHEDRMVHRKTWMDSPWVCNGNAKRDHNKPGCMHVYFVMGRVSDQHREPVEREKAEFGDIIELTKTEENMNSGKTVDWFRAARARFPDAWFVSKGDMDTYIYTHNLMPQLMLLPWSTHHVYGGKANDNAVCRGHDFCPKGWIYMSGGFYFLSQSLVTWYARPDNKVVNDNYAGLAEDLLLGKALRMSGFPILYQIWPISWEPWQHLYTEKNMTKFFSLREDELTGEIVYPESPILDTIF